MACVSHLQFPLAFTSVQQQDGRRRKITSKLWEISSSFEKCHTLVTFLQSQLLSITGTLLREGKKMYRIPKYYRKQEIHRKTLYLLADTIKPLFNEISPFTRTVSPMQSNLPWMHLLKRFHKMKDISSLHFSLSLERKPLQSSASHTDKFPSKWIFGKAIRLSDMNCHPQKED